MSDTVAGRTRAVENRQKILDAAATVFLQEGFSRTSLERIAEVAGVTKPTIYSHYQSKKGLFDAVIEFNTRQRLEELSEVLKPTGDLQADLIRFGDLFLSRVLSPDRQRWDRLAAAESINHPELGKKFFAAGPARLVARIADYLKAQERAGLLNLPDPKRAAEQLIGMFFCLDLLRTQIGHDPPGAAKRKRRCREAVAVFLKAYGVDQ